MKLHLLSHFSKSEISSFDDVSCLLMAALIQCPVHSALVVFLLLKPIHKMINLVLADEVSVYGRLVTLL